MLRVLRTGCSDAVSKACPCNRNQNIVQVAVTLFRTYALEKSREKRDLVERSNKNLERDLIRVLVEHSFRLCCLPLQCPPFAESERCPAAARTAAQDRLF